MNMIGGHADELSNDLRRAYRAWARSEAWVLRSRSTSTTEIQAAQRPGFQWMYGPALFGSVLIRDDFAFIRSFLFQSVALGISADPALIAEIVGDRWLRCPAKRYLAQDRQLSALGMFGKPARLDTWDNASALRESREGASKFVELSTPQGKVVLQYSNGDQTPRITAVATSPEQDYLDLSYVVEDLTLPDVESDGLIDIADVRAELKSRSSARKRGQTRKRTQTLKVEVKPPDEPGEDWGIHSGELVSALNVENGHDAEAIVQELLNREDPGLAHEIDFDSYDTTFSAYAKTETAANALAELVQRAAVHKP